jgi:hypothetical protein
VKTRTHIPTVKRAPAGPLEWNHLLSKAIKRAELKGDNRLAGLRKASSDGKAESILRRFGILSEADLVREFPD